MDTGTKIMIDQFSGLALIYLIYIIYTFMYVNIGICQASIMIILGFVTTIQATKTWRD